MKGGSLGSWQWHALLWLAVPLTAAAGEAVRSVDIVDSAAFLESYRVASEAQSAEFFDLYSDRAVIHARARDHDQAVAIQGKTFKMWGRQLLRAGPGSLDGSVFREATVEQRGIRLVIRAQRYSSTRCYWDPTYVVGIEKEGATYRIVEERLTTVPASTCSPNQSVVALAERSTALADAPLRVPPGISTWRPLSQEEIRLKAQLLAQQMAVARPGESRVGVRADVPRPGNPVSVTASVAPIRSGDLPPDSHVTPQE